jgi:hypothetical protein
MFTDGVTSPVVVDDPETLVNDSTSSSVFIGVVARLVLGSSRERARLDTDLSDLLWEPASRRPTLACFLPASCVSFNAAALLMILSFIKHADKPARAAILAYQHVS